MKKGKHTGWIFLLVLAILITHMPTAKMGEDNDTDVIYAPIKQSGWGLENLKIEGWNREKWPQ